MLNTATEPYENFIAFKGNVALHCQVNPTCKMYEDKAYVLFSLSCASRDEQPAYAR